MQKIVQEVYVILALAAVCSVIACGTEAPLDMAESLNIEDETLQEADIVYFRFKDGHNDTFTFKLQNRELIRQARSILSGKHDGRTHIGGTIIPRPSGYDAQWSYHLAPKSIYFFENAVEVCDADIAFVEEHLDDVGGAFLPGNRWCPWSSMLVTEVVDPTPICAAQLFPVCGKDGTTYLNNCFRAAAGTETACEGYCPCERAK